MNLAPSRAQARRARRTALIVTGALLTGAGAAHAQTFGTTVVAPSQIVVDQFSTTTTAASPTYTRVAIASGLNLYSSANKPGPSGIGSAVTYATPSLFTPTANGSYTVTTSATGYDPGNHLQYTYSPSFNPSSSLSNVQTGFYTPGTNSGSYNLSLSAGTPIQFVDAGYYSPSKYSQVPGSGSDSLGTANTTVYFNSPGSTMSIPDNSPAGAAQTLNVTNSNYVTAFNSITIDGLNHSFIGDLTATLTHNGVTVDLFDHTGANNTPGTPGYNYGQGSQAAFDGNNYTFALSGASLAAVQGFTSAPDTTTFAATGNAANGFDPAHAGNTLNSFLGQGLFGAWTLNITDQQGDDTGSFTGFSFNVNSSPVPETSTGIGFGLLLSLIVLGRAGQVLQARRRSASAAADA